MGKRESYEAKTTELIQPVVEANGVELFDVDYVKEGSDWYLRVYIDKEGGYTTYLLYSSLTNVNSSL